MIYCGLFSNFDGRFAHDFSIVLFHLAFSCNFMQESDFAVVDGPGPEINFCICCLDNEMERINSVAAQTCPFHKGATATTSSTVAESVAKAPAPAKQFTIDDVIRQRKSGKGWIVLHGKVSACVCALCECTALCFAVPFARLLCFLSFCAFHVLLSAFSLCACGVCVCVCAGV